MPTSADVLQPEGEAGKHPLPRRLGAALGGDNSVRWVGFAFALLPAAGLLFVLVTLVVEAAVLGTLLLAVCVLVIGGTISVFTGLYLSEFARGRRRGARHPGLLDAAEDRAEVGAAGHHHRSAGRDGDRGRSSPSTSTARSPRTSPTTQC